MHLDLVLSMETDGEGELGTSEARQHKRISVLRRRLVRQGPIAMTTTHPSSNAPTELSIVHDNLSSPFLSVFLLRQRSEHEADPYL